MRCLLVGALAPAAHAMIHSNAAAAAVATNMGDPHCGNAATVTAYKTGIPFAVNTIASLAPHVSMCAGAP